MKEEDEEYMDKINEFRDLYSFLEEDFSNERIFKALKENEFKYENAFISLLTS